MLAVSRCGVHVAVTSMSPDDLLLSATEIILAADASRARWSAPLIIPFSARARHRGEVRAPWQAVLAANKRDSQRRRSQAELRGRERSSHQSSLPSALAPIQAAHNVKANQESSPSEGSRSSVYDAGDWLSYSPEECQAAQTSELNLESIDLAAHPPVRADVPAASPATGSSEPLEQRSIDIGALSSLPLEAVLRKVRLAQSGVIEDRTSALAFQSSSSASQRRRSDNENPLGSRSKPYHRSRNEMAPHHRRSSVTSSVSARTGLGGAEPIGSTSSTGALQLVQPIPRPLSGLSIDMAWANMFDGAALEELDSLAPRDALLPPTGTGLPFDTGATFAGGRLPATFLSPFASPPAHVALGIPPPMPIVPPEEISPLFTLTLEAMVRPQLGIYVARIHPMIPVFSPEWLYASLDDPAKLQNREHIAMILAMTALSLVHPLESHEVCQKPTRARHATILMNEALRLGRKWDFGCSASYEACMTSYYLFGALFELGYAAGAKLRLREAITLGETMGLDNLKTYIGLSRDEVQRRIRLYWILSVTER